MQPRPPVLHPDMLVPPYILLGEGGDHIVVNVPDMTRASYAVSTGEPLDLASRNNVVFDDLGNYALIDALPPTIKNDQRIFRMPGVVRKVQAGIGLDFSERVQLMNTLGPVRMANFMAACQRLPHRIGSFVGSEIRQETWHRVLSQISRLPTPQTVNGPTAFYAE